MRWTPRRSQAAVLALMMFMTLGGALTGPAAFSVEGADENDTDCARRYVGTGDNVPKGVDHDDIEGDYPSKLRTEHLRKAPGPWCLYETAEEDATSDNFVTGGSGNTSQLSQALTLRPDLVTIHIGRHDAGIVEHVTTCLQNIKDHEFIQANACALLAYANQPAWDELGENLTLMLGRLRTHMDGNPDLVVAVLGYYNPYPKPYTVAARTVTMCAQLIDTMPMCQIRWVQLPPALITLDQVVKKLNTTIEEAVAKFTLTSQGRFVFVNPYEKFSDHCTEMQVEIKTTVYHPTNTVHDHNASKQNFGCDDTWIESDGENGNRTPLLYLMPAVAGQLLTASQTTSEMGVNPNADGHECIAELIWNATKIKLGVPEAPVEDSELCQ